MLDDRTLDGCSMAMVPLDGRGDLITLTIGGNDLLWNRDKCLREGIDDFQQQLAELLARICRANPRAHFYRWLHLRTGRATHAGGTPRARRRERRYSQELSKSAGRCCSHPRRLSRSVR
jgi:lysophospholipase L1-like esterase